MMKKYHLYNLRKNTVRTGEVRTNSLWSLVLARFARSNNIINSNVRSHYRSNNNLILKPQPKGFLDKLRVATGWLTLISITIVGWPGHALAASGDGLMTTGSSLTAFSYKRAWTAGAPGSWGGETGGPTITCSSGDPYINWEVLKADPSTPDRYAFGAMYSCPSASNYNIDVWNYSGGSWTSEFSVATTVGQQSYRGMDIEFERSSGNVVVVYVKSASTTTYYFREGTWGGSNYGLGAASESSGTFTNTIGDHRFYILAPRLASDEMILLAAGASATTRNLVARVWNGSTFGTESPDLGLAFSTTNWDFDCAYETNTGEAMCAWGFSGTPYWKYAAYTPGMGGWQPVTPGATTNLSASIRVLDLDPNPNPDATYGDDIVGGIIETATANDADGLIWTGAGWTGPTSLDTGVNATAAGRQVAVKYASNSNDAILVYDDATTADTDYSRSINGAAFGAPTNVATAGSTDANIQLVNESTDDKIMFMRLGGMDSGLYAYEYDMSGNAWTATNGGAALEADMTSINLESYNFGYNTPYKVPTLTEILFLILVGVAVFVGVKSGVIKLKPGDAKTKKKELPDSTSSKLSNSNHQKEPLGSRSGFRRSTSSRSIDGLDHHRRDYEQ